MQRLFLIGTLLLAFGVSLLAAQDACPALADLVATCETTSSDSVCTLDGMTTLPDLPAESAALSRLVLSGSDEAEIVVTFIGTRLSDYALSASSGLIEISNRAGYNVNLRGGPGSGFEVVGSFDYDETLLADGRSADGQWFRVQIDSGPAWVGAGLVAVDPALDDLPVVDQNTTSLSGHALSVTVVESDCFERPGVLLSTNAETTQRLSLNDMPLALAQGMTFVELVEDGLVVFPLSGAISLGATTETLDLRAVRWSDDGPINLDPAPTFPPLDYLNVLPAEADRCLIAAANANVSMMTLAEPTSEADTTASLDGQGTYPAVQRSGDGAWLRVADAYGAGWLPIDTLQTWGDCDSLPEQAAVTVLGAGLSPDQVMMSYLQARVNGDRATMSALACDAFQGQVALQAQSFRAMQAELLGVTCTATQQDSGSAVVVCGGSIQTNYNGELRQWPPGSYTLTLENEAWRVCGEAG